MALPGRKYDEGRPVPLVSTYALEPGVLSADRKEGVAATALQFAAFNGGVAL